MDFQTATGLIVSLIKRPDKEASVKQCINRAIQRFVASGTFAHDFVELPSLAIDGSLFAQSFDITASPFARFRKMKYMKLPGVKNYITWIDPSQVFSNNCEATDVWYRSGNNIVFRTSSLASTMLVGYYKYHAPLVLDADTDWMLDEMWSPVHDLSVSYAMQDIGNTDESTKYFAWAMDNFKILMRDLGDGVAHA